MILYSLLTVGVSLLVRIIYGVYCKRNFDECKTFVFTLDRGIFKEMLAFAGWNSVGVLSYTLREHGSNIVLNMFFGPTVNAAKGISTQVLGALTKFSGSFMMALNPQITKTYASDEKDRVMTLVFQGARLSYYMMFLISLPILISTNQILSLWLGVVPEYAIVFVQLSIISSLITTLMTPLLTLMQATGDIRNYQIADACVTLFSLPMSYVLLRMGLYPEAVLVVNIVILSMSLLVQLFMLKGMVGLPFLKFVKEVISNVFLVSVMSTIIPLVLSMYFSHSFGSFILLSIVAILSTVITVYTIGCNEAERELIIKTIKQKFSIN
ncbi:MAG: MATE family efflux transporter [bacterium]